MGRFIAGFLVATLLWGGLYFAEREGYLQLGAEEPIDVAAVPKAEGGDEEEAEPSSMRRRRGRRGRRRAERRGRTPTGTATTGDDLGENDPRELAAGESGGEQQLSSAQIEAGFDGAFGRIRRCLILVPEDAPTRGRLTFGLRIRGDGTVTRVNLRGPAAVTGGEAGGCLRGAARSIRFPSFDGPEMIAHYPITLE